MAEPTEKTTGELVTLMFKLTIQLFPIKVSMLVKLHLNFSLVFTDSFLAFLFLPEFSCPSKLRAVS